MFQQTTLGREVRAIGTGLHSGNLIELVLKPAAPNTGILFCRKDLNGESVKASIENIDFAALQMATSLRRGEVVVQTTEHLLSALYGMGVDNVIVDLNGPEVPIMDGSAMPFLILIEEAGIKYQAAPRKTLKVIKPFEFESNGKRVWAEPCSDFRISYEIRFDHPLIQTQRKTIAITPQTYEQEVSAARTFGFLRDVSYLKSKGLIRGGSVDNAIVLDGDRMLNGSLRLEDEFVSHKILDFIGDLAVSGFRLEGHFHGYKAGHETHAQFLNALLAAPEHFAIRQANPAVLRSPRSVAATLASRIA